MLLVKDTMTRHVEVIGPDNTVKEAALKMMSLNIGGLPVCEDQRIIGIVTDRDLTIRSTAKGYDPNNIKIREVMTPNVECCYMDESIKDVANKMQEKQIRRLPVMSNNNTLIGIVTVGDFAKRGSRKIAIRVLEKHNNKESQSKQEN